MAARLPKGWKRIELGELVEIGSGGTPSRANADYWGGNMPWITAKDMKSFDLRDSIDRLTDSGAAHASVVPQDTILVLVRGMGLFKDVPIGVTARPMAFNQDIKALRPKDDVSARFLGHALRNQRHYLMGIVDQAGHGTGRLQTSFLEELPLAIPPQKEQHRIVAALDSADAEASLSDGLLAQQAKMYEVLVDRFVRSALRGQCADAWRRIRLGDALTERDERSDALPLLAITARDGLVLRDDIERRDTSSEDKSKYKVVRKGDIGYNTMRMWQGVFGLSQNDGIVSPAYTVATPRNDIVSSAFIAHLFRHPRVIHQFRRYSQGLVDDTLQLKFPHFAEIELAIPDIDAQMAIAEVLDAQLRYIDVLKRAGSLQRRKRRGLMQKLLSGEWRLTRELPEPVEMSHA